MTPPSCSFTKMESVHKLTRHPKNPNKHSNKQVEMLAKIIEYQGFRHPIVVSKRSNFIVAGHCRLEAAINLGIEMVPVDEQDFASEAQENAFMIADNKIAELAESDDDFLKSLALDLPDSFDLDLLGIPDFSLKDPYPESVEIGRYDEKAPVLSLHECPKCKHQW